MKSREELAIVAYAEFRGVILSRNKKKKKGSDVEPVGLAKNFSHHSTARVWVKDAGDASPKCFA